MSADVQRTKRRRNIATNFNRLSRVHERYRQQTTDRRMDDDIEREFTFAKNCVLHLITPYDEINFCRFTSATNDGPHMLL